MVLGYDTKTSFSTLHVELVFITSLVVTVNYYAFIHWAHGRHGFYNGDNGDHGPHGYDVPHSPDGPHRGFDPRGHGQDNVNKDHHGGRFDGTFMAKYGLFLWGLAFPLLLLTLVSFICNPSTSTKGAPPASNEKKEASRTDLCPVGKGSGGDGNGHKWTLIWLLLPLIIFFFDSPHKYFPKDPTKQQMGWGWFNSVLMSFMIPMSYAAIWAINAFLIPVTKQLPIINWL